MKRKRGRKPAGKKAAPAAAAAESPSPDPPSSPSTEATNSTPDQAEEDNVLPVTKAAAAAVAAPEPPPPPPPPEPAQKPSAAAPANPPVDIPYTKPKVGAVYGRVKLKFKSSKAVDLPPLQQQGSSGAQAPAAGAGKSESATVPEVMKEADAEKAGVRTDGQQRDMQASELSDADKEKVARKVGGIKIKSAGLSSVGNNTPDRKADSVDEPPPSKQEAVSENKEIKETMELRSSQESEEKQSTPERQRDEKELAAALEAIKKVMKMDAAEPFNVPVDPVALGIPHGMPARQNYLAKPSQGIE
ncbi:bromodomain-containing factor 2 [Panicum miliaceum]|uniref:Bromodomain-containing factor 2 n=1 Tax=Panicum miliaceum TaxID=4540 RepID=A0A3L6RIZ9_PANMI|nr:bromodomain-containing factor 2 [Panicum miliaceum]